jgi:hypothetical protein
MIHAYEYSKASEYEFIVKQTNITTRKINRRHSNAV